MSHQRNRNYEATQSQKHHEIVRSLLIIKFSLLCLLTHRRRITPLKNKSNFFTNFRKNINSSHKKFKMSLKDCLKVWNKCIQSELCIVIWSLKIFFWEKKILWTVLLQILDLLNSLIQKCIFSQDAELQALLLLRLSILKTWKLNINQFVIFLVWDLFSICWCSEKVCSSLKITMTWLNKIVNQNSTFKKRSSTH